MIGPAGLAGALMGGMVGWSDLTEPWESQAAQAILRSSAPPGKDPGLVRIVVDDLADQTWPWPKLDYAILLHAIAPYEPEVLALDWPLELRDPLEDVYERQLARQLKAFRGVVLSARPLANASAETSPAPAQEGLPVVGSIDSIPPLLDAVWPRNTYWGEVRISPLAAGRPASARTPLLFRQGDAVVPAFPLAVYAKWLGAYGPNSTVFPGKEIILRDYQQTQLARIPIDASGALRRLPPERLPEVPRLEFYSAILSSEQLHNGQEPLFDLNRLRHTLVLATIEHPDAATPIDGTGLYAGEDTARTLLQLMTRAYWEPVPAPASWVILILSSGLMAWAGSLRPTLHAVAGLVAGVVFLTADAWFFLRFFDTLLPWAPALVASLTGWSTALALAAVLTPSSGAASPAGSPSRPDN